MTDTNHTDAPTLCETCGAASVELFGYNRPDGWHWFCALCRISPHYADKRVPAPDDIVVPSPSIVPYDENPPSGED